MPEEGVEARSIAGFTADRDDSRESESARVGASARTVAAVGPSVEPSDPLEAALLLAAKAGRFDVVAQLAKEIEARRLAVTGNVVALEALRKGR